MRVIFSITFLHIVIKALIFVQLSRVTTKETVTFVLVMPAALYAKLQRGNFMYHESALQSDD